MMMKHQFECLTLVIILCLSFTSPAFANTQEPNVSKPTMVEKQIEPKTDGYYVWEITSKNSQGETYGSWKNLPVNVKNYCLLIRLSYHKRKGRSRKIIHPIPEFCSPFPD